MAAWLAPLISTVGSLIGGKMQQDAADDAADKQRRWALQDQAEQFVRLRSAAEKGGFNPLTVLGVAPGSGMPRDTAVASANYMGSAIADSALMLADSLVKTKAAAQAGALQKARAANVNLQRKLTAATLRPTVPGIYGRTGNATAQGAVPRVAPAQRSGAGAGSGGGASGLLTADPLDPRRGVDNKPVTSSPGFFVVDNPFTGRLYVPTLDGDEALHWYDYPDVVPGLLYNAAKAAWNAGGRYAQRRETDRRQREATPNRYYVPSGIAGSGDLLTGSARPAARIRDY